jgi:Ca2+-binding EF-hand superfamily protein
MYPTGIGSSFQDVRRSNFTKSQSLQYSNGHVGMKDISETTGNVAPHPTDMLGTNLRRGKGLTFSKGIANFDGFVQGQAVDSRPGSAMGQRPGSSAGRTQQDIVASARGPSLTDAPGGGSSFRPQSGRPASGRSQQPIFSARYDGSRPPSGRPATAHSSGRSFRPQSAPVTRNREVNIEELPAWARDQLVAPSFAKTVENQKVRPSSARMRPGSGLPLSSIPKWISLDKKVLTYQAYFKEAVEESRIERGRVRICIIKYYLEDDTLAIMEPREENSGIPQGIFLKRHKAPRPGGGSGFLTWRDLPVPGDLVLYRRTFRVTKCDSVTKDFLKRAGIVVGSEEEVPSDERKEQQARPSSSYQQKAERTGGYVPFHGRQKNDMSEFAEARLGKCQDQKELITKFLQNDGKVLRFYCTWDESGEDGKVEKRPFVLHFFLCDDTVEILEVATPNSGRDPFPALLKRIKLPKASSSRGIQSGGGTGPMGFYSAHDLRVGGVVSVFGRQLVLNQADGATVRYYKEHLGIDVEAGAMVRGVSATSRASASSAHGSGANASAASRPRSALLVPPHNGFGKEEDSRQNCLSLHPKPPRINVVRLLENKGKMLRFVAKLEHAVGFDVERVFTLTYFLDTDELAIFEPPVKNSGRTGGKFMERCKVRKPRSSDHYTEADLYLGARISVYSRRFVLVDADEYTLKYMEQNLETFPMSDFETIQARIQPDEMAAIDQHLRSIDRTGSGLVSEQDFKHAVISNTANILDQEVHTLARRLAVKGGQVDYESLIHGLNQSMNESQVPRGPSSGDNAGGASSYDDAVEKLQSFLYRRGPMGVRGLQRALEHVSRGSGAVDRADLDTVLGFCGITLGDKEVSTIFNALDRGQGTIDNLELIATLRPPLSRVQEQAVLEVFDALEDPTFKTGAVDLNDVIARYRPGRHPRVATGEISESEALRELQDGLENVKQGAVMAKDMLEHYSDVVAGYGLGDDALISVLRATWGMGSRH